MTSSSNSTKNNAFLYNWKACITSDGLKGLGFKGLEVQGLEFRV